eukprot:scaffold297638_cov32-Prasinocladus_malaysianus.AAC.1
MCCDHRVMTEDGFVGLNEVALGIPVPIFWTELFMHLVGGGKGEKLLKSGKAWLVSHIFLDSPLFDCRHGFLHAMETHHNT